MPFLIRKTYQIAYFQEIAKSPNKYMRYPSSFIKCCKEGSFAILFNSKFTILVVSVREGCSGSVFVYKNEYVCIIGGT
jgi:hypothetical protein